MYYSETETETHHSEAFGEVFPRNTYFSVLKGKPAVEMLI